MVTKYLAPSGVSTFIDTENVSTGNYTGGNGYTFRTRACGGASCGTSVTNYEMFTIHKLAKAAPVTFALTDLSSTNWAGFTTTDLTYMLTRNGALQSTMPSITTSATTDLVVAGMTAGTYTVSRNGSSVAGCSGIVVANGDNSLYCPDVSAGAITIDGSVAPGSGLGVVIRGGTLRGVVR